MLGFSLPFAFHKKMGSLIVQRIFKFNLAPKYYFLTSATFPIQKSFLSNLTTLEDAYQNAKAYCKGEQIFVKLVVIISYQKLNFVLVL